MSLIQAMAKQLAVQLMRTVMHDTVDNVNTIKSIIEIVEEGDVKFDVEKLRDGALILIDAVLVLTDVPVFRDDLTSEQQAEIVEARSEYFQTIQKIREEIRPSMRTSPEPH